MPEIKIYASCTNLTNFAGIPKVKLIKNKVCLALKQFSSRRPITNFSLIFVRQRKFHYVFSQVLKTLIKLIAGHSMLKIQKKARI